MASTLESCYDYIVCGGGSAGCVVAARLTEDKDTTVLLLEAGISDLDWPATETPAVCATLQRTEVDWDYKCEPQSFAYKGYKDVTWTRAKMLGGCSSHNDMIFTRCAAHDYDSWAENGCIGWSWKDVLPYFLKSENCICPDFAGSDFHDEGGPVTISKPNEPMAVTKAFMKAGSELGYEEIDAMSGNIIGFGYLPATIDGDGKRASTSRAFIHPIRSRPNLTVLCEAHVSKLEIKNKKAVGVHFVSKGERRYVSANKEIIVSGGPINTPQILMLSGIGPKTHLDEFGIECIADLPVGQNLQDHMAVKVKVSVKPGAGAWNSITVPSTTNAVEAASFINSGLESDLNRPDYQIHLICLYYTSGPDEPDIQILESEKFYPYMGYNTTREQRRKQEGFSLLPTILHPKSIGEIRLKSSNPLDPPAIDPHYLEDPHDVKVMIEGIRMSKMIVETKAMEKFECKLLNLNMPEGKHDEWSDENLEEYVRHFAYTLYHPIGTCKMGAADDSTAVVDPQLRVLGIQGLRVVDSSIMPSVTSGNTNAPSIMIGEKGADMIKNTVC